MLIQAKFTSILLLPAILSLRTESSKEQRQTRLKGPMMCASVPQLELICGMWDATTKMPNYDCRWEVSHKQFAQLPVKKCKLNEFCSMSVDLFDYQKQSVVDDILQRPIGTVVNGSLGCMSPPRGAVIREACQADKINHFEKKLNCLCNDRSQICNRYDVGWLEIMAA